MHLLVYSLRLTEHEVTKPTELVSAMAARMDVQLAAALEVEEVK